MKVNGENGNFAFSKHILTFVQQKMREMEKYMIYEEMREMEKYMIT